MHGYAALLGAWAFCAATNAAFASAQPSPRSLAVDATTVFWTNDDGTVVKLDKGAPGTTPTVLAAGQHSPLSLALDAEYAYWASPGDGAIRRVAKGGGAVETIADASAIPRVSPSTARASTGRTAATAP
jgi:hypothetical protein